MSDCRRGPRIGAMLRLVVACSVLRGPLAFRDSVPKSSPPRRVAPWRRPRAFMTATLDSVDAAFLEAEAFKEEDEEERAPAATSRAREWFDGALAAARRPPGGPPRPGG